MKSRLRTTHNKNSFVMGYIKRLCIMFGTVQIIASTKTFIKHFASDKRAVTAMEYGLIAALIAVAIITAVTLVGTNLQTMFAKISTAI